MCELVDVTEVSENFKCTEDIIEKIIRTEIILERQEEKDIQTSLFIEAMNTVGIKTKMIKKDEIPEAIRIVKEFVNAGRLRVNDDIIKKISAIRGAEEWDDLDMDVRVSICQTYGVKQYPDYNMFMTPTNEIRKSKARGIIFIALKQKYLETA